MNKCVKCGEEYETTNSSKGLCIKCNMAERYKQAKEMLHVGKKPNIDDQPQEEYEHTKSSKGLCAKCNMAERYKQAEEMLHVDDLKPNTDDQPQK